MDQVKKFEQRIAKAEEELQSGYLNKTYLQVGLALRDIGQVALDVLKAILEEKKNESNNT